MRARAAAEAVLAEALEAELILDATIAASETQRRMLWRMREELSPEAQKREGELDQATTSRCRSAGCPS